MLPARHGFEPTSTMKCPASLLFYFALAIRPKEASDSDFTIEDAMLWPGMRLSLPSQCKCCSAGRLQINHFRICTFSRKQVSAWFRRSSSDKTGQNLTLHRYGTNKQCDSGAGTSRARDKSSLNDLILILIVRYVCYHHNYWWQ